jgi:hypothetical protein
MLAMTRVITLFAASLLALGCLQPAMAANDKAKGQGNDQGGAPAEVDDTALQAVITTGEIAIFKAFIAEHGPEAFGPPQNLPPGIAKNLARGKPLPPGIAKRYLPYALLVRLPARPEQTWVVVDNDIVLLRAGTSLVVDMLADAF